MSKTARNFLTWKKRVLHHNEVEENFLMPYIFVSETLRHQQLAAASRLLDDPPSREKLRMVPLNYSYLSDGQKAIRKFFHHSARDQPMFFLRMLCRFGFLSWHTNGACVGFIYVNKELPFFKLLTGIIWGCFLRTPRFILNQSKCWIPVL